MKPVVPSDAGVAAGHHPAASSCFLSLSVSSSSPVTEHTHTHTGEFSVRTHSRYTPDGKTTTKTVAVPDRSVAADMQMTLCYSGCSAFLDSDDSSLWNFLLKALALPHRHVERQGGFLPLFKCVCCHALWNSSIRAEGVNAVRRTR